MNDASEREDGTSNFAKRDMDRALFLLALSCLAGLVLGFYFVSQQLGDGVWRDLLLGIISNVAATLLVFVILYITVAHIVARRRQESQNPLTQESISRLTEEIISKTTGNMSDRINDLSAQLSDALSSIPDDVARRLVLDREADSQEVKSRAQGVPILSKGQMDSERRRIVQAFLEATHRLIAALTANADLRMYCHAADESDGLLYPICTVSSHMDDDSLVTIPYAGPESRPFVLAKVMQTMEIAAWNLEPGHITRYPDRLRTKIRPDLKCVLAAPIMAYDPSERENTPIGTVSLDCTSASLQELGMANPADVVVPEINDILKSCARAIHYVLVYTELPAIRDRD